MRKEKGFKNLFVTVPFSFNFFNNLFCFLVLLLYIFRPTPWLIYKKVACVKYLYLASKDALLCWLLEECSRALTSLSNARSCMGVECGVLK